MLKIHVHGAFWWWHCATFADVVPPQFSSGASALCVCARWVMSGFFAPVSQLVCTETQFSSIFLHLSVIRDALLFRMLLSLLLHYLPWLSVDDKSVHCLFCQTSNLSYSHLCHSAGISCPTAAPAGQACGKRVKKTTVRQHAHSRETTATLLTARPVAIATICLLRSTGMQGWQDGGGGGGGQGSALCFLLPSACLCGSFQRIAQMITEWSLFWSSHLWISSHDHEHQYCTQ